MTKILPLLTASSAGHPSFHVVAPSLPGFAWSEGVLEKGFRAEHYAEVSNMYRSFEFVLMIILPDQLFNKLMVSLGYTEYVTQGGDLGHRVRSKIIQMTATLNYIVADA